MSLMISMLKKLLEYFMKNKYKKQIKKDLGQKKLLKEKETTDNSFNSWIDKKSLIE